MNFSNQLHALLLLSLYLLNRRLSTVWTFWNKENFLPLLGIKPHIIQPAALSVY